ncbi:MAG: hypothetical protein GX622_09345 [Bacteroidales bacterium]|nr:hypothetical protein [Bacteroidales bacterium]
MKKLFLFLSLSLLILPAEAQFKAKMYFTSMGKDHVFTVYSSDVGYRYEFNEDGQAGVVIAKTGSPDIYILMPQQKMAMKSSADNPMTLGNDPVGSYEYHKENATIKEIGHEKINGIDCLKTELWNINSNEFGQVNQKLFTGWTSDEYDFPVKIINHIEVSGESTMEIREIEPWTPDPGYLEVPDGYQVVAMPKM